ncbi:hypothetical protein [Dyella caseinilytica]|uniref:Uncharacterized protein n=1 Tax=Dyella caseinilytica TaxID=1849581 RepID=A0ABX7GY58_9GAMM|nr:hypothetical protein [Dyella caseinilytica]QRN55229.1 hypothetical protein ISN74_07840 [Dyella caseinilytica]GGA00263.1 hypothetical protein GCM10011408_21450 [Dyella caseinilytica]
MSANLVIGDEVELNVGARKTIHTIIARKLTAHTRSGVSYRLLPAVSPEWIDAGQLRKAKGFSRHVSRKAGPFEIAP